MKVCRVCEQLLSFLVEGLITSCGLRDDHHSLCFNIQFLRDSQHGSVQQWRWIHVTFLNEDERVDLTAGISFNSVLLPVCDAPAQVDVPRQLATHDCPQIFPQLFLIRAGIVANATRIYGIQSRGERNIVQPFGVRRTFRHQGTGWRHVLVQGASKEGFPHPTSANEQDVEWDWIKRLVWCCSSSLLILLEEPCFFRFALVILGPPCSKLRHIVNCFSDSLGVVKLQMFDICDG
mmetsp:Transcript_62644/g.148389  ORF Transcript_62644/g.148389 Transcript_62644/m.148389 type:complete len:234 (+) Transcript_62644:265-966(+)